MVDAANYAKDKEAQKEKEARAVLEAQQAKDVK